MGELPESGVGVRTERGRDEFRRYFDAAIDVPGPETARIGAAARAAGYKVMVGCMLGTSLGMAPALLVAQGADVVDLDGPLLLARDRVPGLRYDGPRVFPPEPALWG